MIFVIMYLQGRLVNSKVYSPTSYTVQYLQLLCLFWALFNCAYRVTDYHHHVIDVVAGFSLGTTVQFINTVFVQKMFRDDRETVPRAEHRDYIKLYDSISP